MWSVSHASSSSSVFFLRAVLQQPLPALVTIHRTQIGFFILRPTEMLFVADFHDE